jgi:hypothetical protein
MNIATKTFLLVSAAYLLGGGSAALAEAQMGAVMETVDTEGYLDGQAPDGDQPGLIKVVTVGEEARREGQGRGHQE